MILLIEKDGQTLPGCGQIQNLYPILEIRMGAGDKDNSFIILSVHCLWKDHWHLGTIEQKRNLKHEWTIKNDPSIIYWVINVGDRVVLPQQAQFKIEEWKFYFLSGKSK